MKNIVITIARQYGSGGKTIGAMLAKDLLQPRDPENGVRGQRDQ